MKILVAIVVAMSFLAAGCENKAPRPKTDAAPLTRGDVSITNGGLR